VELIKKFTQDSAPFYCVDIKEAAAEREELRLILEEIQYREELEELSRIYIIQLLEQDHRELQAQL